MAVNFHSITTRLVLWFTVLVFTPLLVTNLISFDIFRQYLHLEVNESLAVIVEHKAQRLEDYTRERLRDVTGLARAPAVVDALQQFSVAYSRGGIDSEQYKLVDQKYRPFLTAMMESASYSELFLIDIDGSSVFSVRRGEDFGSNFKQGVFRETELAKVYELAMTLSETELSDFSYYPVANEPAAFIASPVFRDGVVIGVVALQINNQSIYAVINDYRGLGKTGDVVVWQSKKDRLVYMAPLRFDPDAAFRRRAKLNGDASKVLQQAAEGVNGQGVGLDYRGEQTIAAWRYLPSLRWGLIVKKDEAEAFSSVTTLTQIMLQIALGSGVALIIIIIWQSLKITKPIHQLINVVQQFADGDLRQRVGLIHKDEVGKLAQAFNKMALNLYETQERLLSNSKILEKEVFERKEADVKLSRLKNYLDDIIDSMPSALIGVDSEGRVTHWNRRAREQTGVAKEQALTHALRDVFPLLRDQYDSVLDAIQSGSILTLDRIERFDNNRRQFNDITIYPLREEVGVGAVLRVDDVSAQVELQELIVQSEKMVSIGGLAAGMAHEINNPLSAISQSIQNIFICLEVEREKNIEMANELGVNLAAVNTYFEKRRVRRFLESIDEATVRAAKIVNDMLAFSRRSESRRAPTNLTKLIDKTLELAATDYNLKKKYDFRKIKIVRQYNLETIEVPCTLTEIQQVLLNLFSNAAQSMYLQDSEKNRSVPTITLRTRQEGQYAVLEVEDNGPGMDEQTRKRVFEPFFTTKEEGVGTGLGLSVSYFIVTSNHKGMINVSSTLGVGTKFSIYLPLEKVK
jgi:PAS domain S-box-containing protein